MSFLTVITSTGDDSINGDRAVDVGRAMQIKLDGQSLTLTIDVMSRI